MLARHFLCQEEVTSSNSLITHLLILVGYNELFISGFSFLGCQDSNKIMASNLCLLFNTKLVNTSRKFYNMVLYHKDWELPNSRV